MPKHAYLSASASHRWLACPPSAKLCAGINDSGSPYAQQGTDAHALCEYKVEKLLGRNPEDPTENLTWFDTEMDDCTDQYAAYVAEQIEEAKTHCSDPLILIEEKLDFSKWVPEGFGTGDCVIVADDVLHIIDFKYGLGVLVDAEENPQMMCYALGALDTYEYLYSIQTIRMTIFQPRRLRGFHPLWHSFPTVATTSHFGNSNVQSYNPNKQACWFGLFPFRSPLLRESMFLSLPAATKMFQFTASTSC